MAQDKGAGPLEIYKKTAKQDLTYLAATDKLYSANPFTKTLVLLGILFCTPQDRSDIKRDWHFYRYLFAGARVFKIVKNNPFHTLPFESVLYHSPLTSFLSY